MTTLDLESVSPHSLVIVAVLLVHLLGVMVIVASAGVLVPMLFIIIRAVHVLKAPWTLVLYPRKGSIDRPIALGIGPVPRSYREHSVGGTRF